MYRKALSPIVLAVLLIGIIVMCMLGYTIYKEIIAKKPLAVTPAPAVVTPTIMDVELPLKVKVTNIFNGSNIAGLKLKIFYKEFQESGVTDSNGEYVTSMMVRPNRPVTVLMYETGVRQWVTELIKGYTKDQLEVMTEKLYKIYVKFKPLGSFSISVLDPSYTSITEGATYNITVTGIDKPSFTIMLKNTKDNSGLPLYGKDRDPETQRRYVSALVITVEGEGVIVTNAELVYSEASKKIYVIKLEPNILDRQVDSAGNIIKEGLHSLTLKTDATALTQGVSTKITISLVTCLDVDYLKSHSGVMNPEAYTTTSFVFYIGA